MSPHVRPLTADEARALTAARLVAVEHAPYFAHALFAVRPVAAESLGTFAVDASWRLYLDPDVLTAWGPALAGGVLVHEVGHLLREHAARGDALAPTSTLIFGTRPPMRPERWILSRPVSPLPTGSSPRRRSGCRRRIEETYYAALHQPSAATPSALVSAPGGERTPDAGPAPETPARRGNCPRLPRRARLGDGEATHDPPRGRRSGPRPRRAHGQGSVPAASAAGRSAPSAPRRAVASGTRLHRAARDRARRRSARLHLHPPRPPPPAPHPHPAMRRPVVTVAVVIDTSAR
jgi:hypothetical protein